MRHLARALVVLALACEGPVGPVGDPGEPGEPGRPGEPGEPGVIPDAGPPPQDLPLEPDGMVGEVRDTSGAPLAGGRVALIGADAVLALAATPIDPREEPATAADSLVDEPIEDLLGTDAELASAPIGADGRYRFRRLPDAEVFVVAVPAADDGARVPGGAVARFAQSPSSLLGTRLDLRVSTLPSARARYVGSSTCVSCHGRHSAFGTAHFNALSVPGRPGYTQDPSRFPDVDATVAALDAGLTLYFHECTGSSPRCEVEATEPSDPAAIDFELELARDVAVPRGELGAYRATFRNRRAAETASYPIELTYGGMLGRTQLIVPVPRAGGVERHLLPVRLDLEGDAGAASLSSRPYRDVGSASWYARDTRTLRTPDSSESFDRACAGCHFTGYELRDEGGAFAASAVPMRDGAYDYDGDGRNEEIGIGCERCHGPGSEHVDAGGRGVAIVSPELLTPGRAVTICASCHSAAGAPVHDGAVARPGIRRADFFATFRDRAEAIGDELHPSGDPARDRLQAASHVSSGMYRNGRALMTCSDCHDAHGAARQPRDRWADDNTLCTSCHGEEPFRDVRMHVEVATGDPHRGTDDDDLRCETCHMPPTAFGGAHQPGLFDDRPSGATPVAYEVGDLASHRYVVSGLERASEQPASVTQSCGVCHSLLLDNP